MVPEGRCGANSLIKENIMGFDLFGNNPMDYNDNDYPMLTKWESKSWDERKDEMNDKEEKQYWKEMSLRDSETGSYFRSNVWWWRRLWDFTIQVCDEVLTEDDKTAGDDNSGQCIDTQTAAKMVPLMRQAIKNKDHEDYEASVTESNAKVEREDNGHIKNDEDFWANYGFSAEFFEEFTTFVERSGGFTVS